MSEIDFEIGTPIWSAAVTHNQPNTPGLWIRAFNASSEEEAIDKAIELFEEDGLNKIRILEIEVTELIQIEGEGATDA